MKFKTVLLALGGLLLAVALRAAVVYTYNVSGYLINQPALAYSQSAVIDMKTAGQNGQSIKYIAATSYISSTTIQATSFTDGGVSTNTVTVNSVANLLPVQATATITVNSTSTITNAILYVNGVKLQAFYQWKIGATTAATAKNIAATMNLLSGIQASASSNVVYATATVAGAAGNSITLTERAATDLVLSSSTFLGGVDPASITINGVPLTVGVNVSTTSLDTAAHVAKSFSDAIMATPSLSAIVKSTWTAGGVIATTSTTAGVNAYNLVCSPTASLTRGGATYSGGSAPAWSLNGTSITKTAHGFATGLPVLYTTDTLAISGLTNATTYYVSVVDANHFALATTSTGAIAGSGIVLASTSTAGPHTYTLTPTPIAGTFGFQWESSDDASTWTASQISGVNVSSVTFATPWTAATGSWDFGQFGHRYIRARATAGTGGAINLQIAVTGRNDY